MGQTDVRQKCAKSVHSRAKKEPKISKNNGLIQRGEIWFMRFTIKGHKVYESTRTSVKRDAEMILAKRKADLIQDVVLDKKRPVDLYEAMDQYVLTRTTPASKRNAANAIKVFKDGLFNRPLKKLARHDVDAVIQNQLAIGRNPNTVQTRINYWKAFTNWCKKQNYIIFEGINRLLKYWSAKRHSLPA